jgi:hypothetical protein
MKLEPKGGSETSAFRTHTPGNYPKENMLHKEHGYSRGLFVRESIVIRNCGVQAVGPIKPFIM